MSLLYFLFLAAIQGITEFLPVSSSAHLALAPKLLGVQDQGYQIDLAVHFGTLFAVMIYFHQETRLLVTGALDHLKLRFDTANARFFRLLAIATIPVVLFGVLLTQLSWYEVIRANPKIIATTMIGFGIILYLADKKFAQTRKMPDWRFKDAVIMGVWQAIALIPGVSRSGATVTASRLLGFERHDGAKIAMLMSIPTILAATAYSVISGVSDGTLSSEIGQNAVIAAAASFVAAVIALSLMMKFLKSASYTPYVIYRILLGIILLYIFW